MKPLPPDFRSPQFLRGHVLHTLSFYDGRCLDPSGGFYQSFRNDGQVADARVRHLVGSARFVITHAQAARHFPEHPRAPAWREAAAHGLDFVQRVHRDGATGAYAWMLDWDGRRATVTDPSQRCYGLAFVLLAHAEALRAGLPVRDGLEAAYAAMEQRFWEPEHGLYADEADEQGRLSAYRGQNANMHACEAMLACHAATGDIRYLERADTLAYSVAERLARHADGLIWEHYREGWTPDWEYHRGDSTDLFRPWGFQPGHLAEWSKLLLTLERLRPGHPSNEALVHRARELFAAAVQHGWDRQHDGLVYTIWKDDTPGHEGRYLTSDGHKHYWVQAEAIAAAALLAERTLEGGYWDWYDRLWEYAWEHFVDHEHGAWLRVLSPDNRPLDDLKSPPCKTDYHTMGACYEVLDSLGRGIE